MRIEYANVSQYYMRRLRYLKQGMPSYYSQFIQDLLIFLKVKCSEKNEFALGNIVDSTDV